MGARVTRPFEGAKQAAGAWQVPVPGGIATCLQPATASQESVVQATESSQLSGVPGLQAPAKQASAPLQTVLSAQARPSIAVCLQPATASHESAVHTLWSSQSSGPADAQVVPW